MFNYCKMFNYKHSSCNIDYLKTICQQSRVLRSLNAIALSKLDHMQNSKNQNFVNFVK